MLASATAQIELFPGTQIVEFDSSTTEKSYRVELTDGRHFQINETLYWLLNCLHMPMSLSQLAAEFEQRTGKPVSTTQLEELSEQLEEQGVIVEAGKAQEKPAAESTQSFSYLGLHWRRDLLSAEVLAPIVRPFRFVFNRPVAILGLILAAATHVLAYRELGFPSPATIAQTSWPLLFVVLLVFALIHEIGHLAACQRWQCPHGPLGIGLYFLQPVFYVDVTSSWRLNRKQRAVVDLGGVYLELLFVPVCWLLYLVTQDITYLMVIFFTDMMILGNFEPFMKLDGYWLLSDLTGVPNLHTRTLEVVKRRWAWLRWRLGWGAALEAESPFSQWSPEVQAVIWSYVFLSMAIWPVLIIAMIPIVVTVFAELPAMWQAALADIANAVSSGDIRAIFGELQVLFLPTMALANLAFLFKRTLDKVRQNKASKQESLAAAS